MRKRLTAALLCLCLLFTLLPATAFAEGEAGSGAPQAGSALCEHHPQHDESCGYTEGTEEVPCTHEHDEDCYKLVTECVHEHTAECYPEESVSENTATPSEAEEAEPTACTHVCSEESGCITKALDCKHEHDEACGYVPATEGSSCTFGCEVCNTQDKDSEATATPSDAQPEECTCETLCTGEEINGDCPVCSAEGAEIDKVCVGAAPMLPVTALAAGTGTDTGKAIQLGTSGIAGYDSAAGYDYIYFGSWTAQDTYTTSGPIKWRVLDDQTNTGETGLFLLSDGLLGTGYYGGVYFDNTSPYSNTWQGSDAQAWCNTFASSNLDSRELAAILETTKSDDAFTSSTYSVPFAASENILNGDKVFFLSAEEAENSAYGFANDNARIANYGGSACAWWLRSPYAGYTDGAGAVYGYGYVDFITVNDDWAARPAFNLDLNSVLFTSAAESGKIPAANGGGNQGGEAADAIFEIGDYTGSEWKLTLLDNSRNFSVTDETASGKPGDTITLNYSGATAYDAGTAPNEYISAMIVDSSGAQYYGRVAQPTTESGKVSVTIPANLASGSYTLNVFSEQYNGDYKTDYASAFDTVTLTVVDATAPILSNGSATRDSETAATVKFTSDEAGTYYYAVVESNEAEPNIDPSGEGTACDTTEQTISIDNLSGAGAKDIYIVAKDAAGNVSQPLKIEIPEFIPTYTISAEPTQLNFESKTVGYTEAPAAQTVTLTNTGNQNVTVDLPTSTNYIITAGEGFTNDTATLAPNGTAAFTVQPKTGLAAGSYDETLTISGDNNTSANIALSFEVDVKLYSVTVNGSYAQTTGAGSYAEGATVTIDAGTRSGYTFDGWTSSDGVTFANAGSTQTTFTMPDKAVTVTANWTKKSSEVSEQKFIRYIVEHYKQNADGSYTLAETERPIDEIGKTVTATPKTYEGYTYNPNAAGTVTSGKLTEIKNDADIVTLKLYYDITLYTVTVNGSYAQTTGAGSYAEGDTVKLDAGTCSGYTFDGWTSSDGVTFANAGNAQTTFTMPDKAVTVTANWTKRSSGGGGGGSSSSSGGGSYTGPVGVYYADSRNDSIPSDATQGTWEQETASDGSIAWKFKLADGSYAADRWIKALWNDQYLWYHMDTNGYLQSGWFTDMDGNIYYLHPFHDGNFGYMYTGDHVIDGIAYNFSRGREQDGLPEGALKR